MRRILPLHIAWSLLTSAALYLQPAQAETSSDLLAMDLETLLTIKVGPSADASAKGLSEAYPGGQIAKGGRVGILGNQDLMDTPFSFTNYTQEFIQNHQAASVGDILQYDPSVRVARGFGNFQQVYKVRGLPIFSDDMTYNGLYGILPRQYLAAEAIERVEILRGANSFLNGAAPGVSGSLGGAIDIIPKRAPKDDLLQFALGAQSPQQHYAAADIATHTNDGNLGFRFNGVDSGGETLVNDESRNLDLAILGADYRGKALRLSADVGYQSHRMDANQPSITIADALEIPTAPDAHNNIAPSWTNSNTQDVFGTLRAEYDFNKQITGWIAGGAREGSEDSRFIAFLTVNNAAGDFSANRFDVIHKDSITTGEVGLRIQFNTADVAHQVTISANTFENQSRNAYVIFNAFTNNIYHATKISLPETVTFAAGSIDNPSITATSKTSSLALADELGLLNETLLITLGARNQRIEEYNYQYDNGAKTSAYDEQKLTPMVAAVYKFSPHYAFYTNYIEGLLKGDIAPANNVNGALANVGESLKPYQTKQIEMGLKYDGGSVGANAGLFQLRKPLTGYSANNRFELKDDQTHKGVDISVHGEPLAQLKILAGASFLMTDIQGKAAIGAPKTQTNLDMEWTLPQWPGFTINGHWMYTGEQFANASNTQKVPAWNRLDLGLRYTTKISDANKLTLRANLENITDENYWASAGGFPGAGYLTLGNPRTLIVSATFNF
jgi:iron complex outermembrane receptor protein